MRLLSCDEMKQVEQYTVKFGLSYQRMMENAGAACARNIKNIIEKDGVRRRNVVIVCGKGNNGGDGFVVARKFAEGGYNVTVVLAGGYPSSREAEEMYKMVTDLAISTVWYDADKLRTLQAIRSADVLVDAVFGFSFYGVLSDDMRSLFASINESRALKFSVDLPSGVYCDSGLMDEGCIVADYTIAISALKPAHIVHPAADCCGDIIIANIGIPADSYSFIKNSMYTLSKAEAGSLVLKRKSVSHKGTYGHLLSICGSKRMPGAPVLAASAALRSGVGLVTAAFPESIYNTMSFKLTEALLMPLKEKADGTLSKDCIPEILSSLDKFSAVLIGCGLGQSDDIREIVEAIVLNSKVPVIIDADGINVLAKNIDILLKATCPIILTPHPMEMARLCQTNVDIIQADRVKHARDFADAFGATLVLKGSNTVVASKSRNSVYINSTGNSGLAKGGSGDVLAGIIAALTASHLSVDTASAVGVYIHGLCADKAADRLSQTGMLPSDVIEELSAVFGEFGE